MAESTDEDSFNTVEYMGEEILLSRTYQHYVDYRDDPNRIATSERARVASLVSRAQPVVTTFRSFEELNSAFYALMFPAFGLSLGPLDGPLCLVSLEIPYSGQEKVFALDKLERGWVLVDQFVSSTENGTIESAQRTKEGILYRKESGETVHRNVKPAI
jgi:hypothetical protein